MVSIKEPEAVNSHKVKKLPAESLALQQPPEAPQQSPEDIFLALKTQKLPNRYEG